MISKRTFLKITFKLTRIHDCVPRCLMLEGFKKTEDHAFALGSCGELWRGQVMGMEVAVKQARIFTGDNDLEKVLRVGCYRFILHDSTFPLQRVRREAIIWKQCDHPNVLPFYGIYRDSAPSTYSTYCLVSPFMVNGSLRQYINKIDDSDRHNLVRTDRFPFFIRKSNNYTGSRHYAWYELSAHPVHRTWRPQGGTFRRIIRRRYVAKPKQGQHIDHR